MNRFLRIRSWNMQGSGCEKIAYVQPSLRDRNSILLCQESGVPGSTGFNRGGVYGDYICLESSIDSVALNQRCTTSILMTCGACNAYGTPICGRCNIFNHVTVLSLEPTNGINIITRKYLMVRYVVNSKISIDIYTYHATANNCSSVSEVLKIIGEITSSQRNSRWILMGDFNAQPDDFARHVDGNVCPRMYNPFRVSIGTSTRPTIGRDCFMLFDCHPTQGSGGNRLKKLDYAFVSPTVVQENLIADFTNDFITDGFRPLSDHNSISILLNLNGYFV